MDGAEDSEDKMEVLPSTESDGATANANGPPVTEEQWSAIRGMLEFLLGYREAE